MSKPSSRKLNQVDAELKHAMELLLSRLSELPEAAAAREKDLLLQCMRRFVAKSQQANGAVIPDPLLRPIFPLHPRDADAHIPNGDYF